VARHGEGASQAKSPRPQPRDPSAAFGLRHRRVLAPVRAHFHQHPHDARARRDPPPKFREDARLAAGHRGRAGRDPARADGAFHRRLSRGGRRGAASAAHAPLRGAEAREERSDRGPDRARERGGRLLPGALRARALRAVGPDVRLAAAAPGGSREGPSGVSRRHQPLSLPRRLAGACGGGHLRSHGDRDRARVHRGLPLLSGGDDLPAGAGARSGASGLDSGLGDREGRLRRGVAHVAFDRGLLLHLAPGEEG